MFDLIKAAVINECTANAYANDLLLSTRVPRTTMRRYKAAFQEATKQHSIPLRDVTYQMIFPKIECGGCATPVDCRQVPIPDQYRHTPRSS